MKIYFLLILLFIVVAIMSSSLIVIDEREQVVITRFGKAHRTIKKPGIYFKLTVLDKVNSFPKVLLEWDGDKGQLPTKDKTYIYVDVFGRWKITDGR